MIKALALKEIAERTGARMNAAAVDCAPDFTFNSVSTDTRALKSGDLFVALRGDRFDAHDFLTSAVDNGASALVVERENMDISLPQLIVEDTIQALGKIAVANRQVFRGVLLAITGSSGKTTVKGMAANILSHCGQVLATKGNLNNHIGVPLTLLQLNAEHDFAVVEMGASAAGEIAYLTSLAQPDVALVNNIMPAHVEGFGSIEGVASAKAEIFSGLKAQGKAIINLDSSFSAQLQAASAGFTALRFRVSPPPDSQQVSDSDCDFFATDIQESEEGGCSFCLHSPSGKSDIHLQVLGRHNVANALAAAACCYAAGADLKAISAGLNSFHSVSGRMDVKRAGNGALVIDDTYNANPGSVRAAIDVLASRCGETVLVLGDLGELGAEAPQLHSQLGEYAKARGIHRLVTVGELSANASQAFGAEAAHFSQQKPAIEKVQSMMSSQTVVLVKGSRSARMELVVQGILANGVEE